MPDSRLLVPVSLLCLAALGCSGQGGEQLGELLGTTEAKLERNLTLEELEQLPALTAIDLEAELTAADYTLWQSHAQAFITHVLGARWLGSDPAEFNALVNRYRFDVGAIVADLEGGAQSPQEVCRFLASVRGGVSGELRHGEILGETGQEQFNAMWDAQEEMWRATGYPSGLPDLLGEAVTEIGLTGPQAADFCELFVKATIDFARVMHPDGVMYSQGTFGSVEAHQADSEEAMDSDACHQLGMQYFNRAMSLLTPEQVPLAYRWHKSVEEKFTSYWRSEQPRFDDPSASATPSHSATSPTD